MPRLSAYWTCQLAGWGLYAAANALLSALWYGPTPTGVVFAVGMSALGLGATHALRGVVRQRRWLQLPVGPLALRMVAGSAAAAAAMAGVALVGFGWVARASGAPFNAAVSFLGAAFNWTALLLIWSGVYAGVHLVRRWRRTERERARAEAERWRLEAAAREAELRALQAQVNPHFLFNSLNTARALIAEDPDRARTALTELSGLLRYALAAGGRETVPLREEVETVRRYLALEGLRFERRLHAEVHAAPEALAARVPPMVVQTLVENAIKHGIGRVPEGGAVRVEARAEAGGVRVTVESPGTLGAHAEAPGGAAPGGAAPGEAGGRPSAPEAGGAGGLGLANATERLRRLCGDRAALVVRQAAPGTVRAEVLLPLAEAEAPEAATARAFQAAPQTQ